MTIDVPVGTVTPEFLDYLDQNFAAVQTQFNLAGEVDAEFKGFALNAPTVTSIKVLTSRPPILIADGSSWKWFLDDTTPDNSSGTAFGTVIEPTSGPAGRYKRIYDGAIHASWFGMSAAATGAANITAGQAALALGGKIELPAANLTLASTQLVPVSNTTIVGVLGATVLTRTGSDVTSYIRPFFNVEDVENVIFDGITFDFTADTSREFGIITRSTTLGATKNIIVRNCVFLNVPNHIERYCDGITYENCIFDGGGASGALCGVATGGVINKTTGGLDATDGLVQNVFIYDNLFQDIRQEGIDINQDTSHVTIDGNQFIDCNLVGGVTNEVIDIGGVNSMANGCRHITVSNNNISFSTATDAVGITVKIYSEDVTIVGNTIRNPTTTSGTGGIVVTDFVRNVTIIGNTIKGWRTSISLSASSTDTSENVVVTGNTCDDYFSAGIAVATGTWVGVAIKGNTLESTIGSGITLANVTRFVVEGNIVRGAAVDCILVNTTATDGNVTGNNVSGSTIDGIRVLGARVTIDGNTTYSNGRHGINAGADNLTITGNTSYNNAQVTANQFGLNIAANSDYIVIVGNNIFDTQGGSATQNGIVFGATCTNITLGLNNIGPVKTTAISGLANITGTVSGIGSNAVQSATIASGVVTCSAGVLQLTLDTEGAGATDDLDTLNYNGAIGDRVMVKAASASRDVVLKNGTGNIWLGADFTLNNIVDAVLLQWDGTLWRKIGEGNNGA